MLNASTQNGSDRFQRVAVIGAGLMGRRLAGIFASGGMQVTLTDVRADLLEAAVAEANGLAHERGGDSAGQVVAVEQVSEAAQDADFITEAIIEDLEVKQRLFADLSELAPDAVLASNSSVLPVSDIARGIQHPERAVGTHWWNPPDLIPIVEVIHGEKTAVDVVDDVISLMEILGKLPVRVHRDTPGFVGNRLQHALWREAIALIEEGVADAATVDLVVRNTIGLRLAQMGPLENADYVGLDLTRAIHEAVFPALSRATTPSALLDELIAAGDLGAKSGQGFLAWPAGAREQAAAALAAHVTAGTAREGQPTDKEHP